jgi:glycosyltransferase involved in cell wall biosynthesis
VRGGTERAVAGIARAIDEHTAHSAELLKLPVQEHTLRGLLAGYRAFAALDVSHFDLVITTKYPAWMLHHPNHTCYLFHPLRGLYDTYPANLPAQPGPGAASAAARLAAAAARTHTRRAVLELLDEGDAALDQLGESHPDLALVSPAARAVVHALDRVARGRNGVRRHLALSHTVARRAGYFPPGVQPEVLYLPPDLQAPPASGRQARHLFTMSRFDRPKRLHLIVEAMRHTSLALPLLIAGTGPQEDELRRLAGSDRRIRFLGGIDDDDAAAFYRDALAVPFVPQDEDYGLITVEAMRCGTPVVTCVDSGGPTELVQHGRTGLVVEPQPRALATALSRLAADKAYAARMGEAAQRLVAPLTWKNVAATLTGGSAVGHAGGTTAGAPVGAAHRRGRPLISVLSTYPVFPALHGGQVRCGQLYGGLTDRFDLHFLCLGQPDTRPADGLVAEGIRQTVLPLTEEQVKVMWEKEAIVGVPLSDVLAGSTIAANPAYLQALDESLAGASLALLAHPYLVWALTELDRPVPLVLDAHNVETSLKRQMYPPSRTAQEVLEAVRRAETTACDLAQIVIACTETDAAELEAVAGVAPDKLHVIPNGAAITPALEPLERRQAATRRWLTSYAGRAGAYTGMAAFVASHHGPNIDAAQLICEVGPDVPEAVFVLGGHHGEALRRKRLPGNVVITGMLSERAKDALLAAASMALNPMRRGSGSNLKMLEYLARGVPAVSTPFGARGLGVRDGEHLLLAEPEHFATAIRAVLADPVSAHRRAEAGLAFVAEHFAWPTLAAQLAALLSPLAGDEAGPR